MIYSISLNSTIDYVVYSKEFDSGHSADSNEEFLYPGGKGINVTRVLTQLGMPVKILGFVGGFTGSYIENALKDEGIATNFIHTLERSRINIKIKSLSESEINGKSPWISEIEQERFFQSLDEVKSGDLVLLCGSLTPSLSSDIYGKVMAYLEAKNVDFVVDTTEEALYSTLKYTPLFIKPNLSELEMLFDVKITHLDEVLYYGRKLLTLGAKNVVVSLAKDGALLITPEKNLMAFVPTIDIKNSVGAGDSLVAGMVYSLRKGYDLIKSFHYGVAVSVTSVASKTLLESREIDKFYDKIRIREI